MIFRCFPSYLYVWTISIVVLMSLPSSTGKRNFYPVNSCTEIKLKEIPIDVFQKCSETNSALHCLPDENNDLGLSCFQVTWISKGKCPSYNSYQGNMDEIDCSTDHGGTCPKDLYKSPSSVLYTGCYIKELIPTSTTTPSVTTETMTKMTMTNMTPTTSKKSSLVPVTFDSSINENMAQTEHGECGWMIAFIVISVLAAGALIAVSCCIYHWKLCDECKQRIRKVPRCKAVQRFQIRKAQNGSQSPDSDDEAKSEKMLNGQ